MFDGVTLFERVILESLEKSPKTMAELEEDTYLNRIVLLNSVYQLVGKNIVRASKLGYELNQYAKPLWLEAINKDDNLELEIEELFKKVIQLAVRKNETHHLKIKKICLNDKDKLILLAMFKNIESFIEDLEQKPKLHKTKDETVIYWGQTNYQEILKNDLV
jgi:hypothetical protein